MDFFDELILQLRKEAAKSDAFQINSEDWNLFLDPASAKKSAIQNVQKTATAAQNSSFSFSLENLKQNILDCRACPLAKVRKNPAVSTGDPMAKLMIVIENPSLLDDEEGTVFSGEVGILLDKMLLAMGLQRSQCYITSVVKCRTPGNRQLTEDEVTLCSEKFFLAEVRAVKPECILAFGAGFAKHILHREGTISTLRGTFDSFDGIPVMSTFNPAYLLRQQSAKKTVWHDLQMVMKSLNLPAR